LPHFIDTKLEIVILWGIRETVVSLVAGRKMSFPAQTISVSARKWPRAKISLRVVANRRL